MTTRFVGKEELAELAKKVWRGHLNRGFVAMGEFGTPSWTKSADFPLIGINGREVEFENQCFEWTKFPEFHDLEVMLECNVRGDFSGRIHVRKARETKPEEPEPEPPAPEPEPPQPAFVRFGLQGWDPNTKTVVRCVSARTGKPFVYETHEAAIRGMISVAHGGRYDRVEIIEVEG